MPGLDGKGPKGQGSQTGRGLGRCNPANKDDEKSTLQRPHGEAFRRGLGKGLGRGMGGAGFHRNLDTDPNNKEKE